MQNEPPKTQLRPTFTHQQPLQYSLTCTLCNATNSEQLIKQQWENAETAASMNFHLLVPTDTFPKIYELILHESSLSLQYRLIFGSLVGLYKAVKDKTNLQILYNWGTVKVKYEVLIGGRSSKKYIEIKLQRSMTNQLEEIRAIVGQKVEGLGDFQMIDNRVDKVWKRIEQNQKIYMKFKQQVQFRIQQSAQRMQIQSTKMNILRQDINKLTTSFDKLSSILCPIFSKLNMNSQHTNSFILQDRKVMYVGDNGIWTQILFKNQLAVYKKHQIGFKIVNSKKCNIVAGITVAGQAGWRSSIGRGEKEGKDRKFIGLSGIGHLFSSQNQVLELKNIFLSHHQESQKQRNASKDKQSKSNYEITLSSPIPTSMKSSAISSKHHPTQSSHSPSGSTFKPMQIIKLCVQLDKQKIYWKNGSKILMETKIGPEFKNQAIVPYFQFCDTGDSIQFVDL